MPKKQKHLKTFDSLLSNGLGKHVSYFFSYKNNTIGKLKNDLMLILALLVRYVIMESVLRIFEYLRKRRHLEAEVVGGMLRWSNSSISSGSKIISRLREDGEILLVKLASYRWENCLCGAWWKRIFDHD